MKKSVFLTLALLFGLVTTPAMAGGIQVEGAWVRAAPPTVKILAAYMTIKNVGDTSKTVVGAHSPQFAKVEFHESLIRNGMATMIARDSLAISAGGEAVLSPGGYHMMLIAPQRRINVGDKIAINLHFSDGTGYQVIANVMKSKGKAMDHSKMDHGNMDHSKMDHGNMDHSKGMNQQHMMPPKSEMMQQMMKQRQMMMQHKRMMQHQGMNHNQGMMQPPGMMGGYNKSKDPTCSMMQHKPGMHCQMHKNKDGKCSMCMKDGKMQHEGCMCMKDGKIKNEVMKKEGGSEDHKMEEKSDDDHDHMMDSEKMEHEKMGM
ncbi:MAG: copper chaperone PCu(A)C [Magnetococcales bacterium]|nr:copper chaperone PCu(A)C [Magnetococcales bacterium]